MTDKVVELLYRSIIQHLAGDKEKSKEYTERARKISKNTCRCGGQTVLCKYNRRLARICTECGIVLQDGRVVQRCWVNSRRAG